MDDGAVPVTSHGAASEYWFARRFPPSDRRNAFAPVHWKGWAVSVAFVSALAVGGVAFAWLGASGQLVQGVAVFAVVALLSGACFIAVATAKGDKTRTVQDYRKAQGRV
jgi:hypothetical protein